jgi:hypothetical protein
MIINKLDIANFMPNGIDKLLLKPVTPTNFLEQYNVAKFIGLYTYDLNSGCRFPVLR